MIIISSIIICVPLLTLLYVGLDIWNDVKYSNKDKVLWWICTIITFICTIFLVWLLNNWEYVWSITK